MHGVPKLLHIMLRGPGIIASLAQQESYTFFLHKMFFFIPVNITTDVLFKNVHNVPETFPCYYRNDYNTSEQQKRKE